MNNSQAQQQHIPKTSRGVAGNILPYCYQARTVSLHGFLLFLPSSIAFAHTCLGLLLLTYLVEAITTKQLILPSTPINRPLVGYVVLSLVMILFSPDISKSFRASTALADVAVFYLIYLAFYHLCHSGSLVWNLTALSGGRSVPVDATARFSQTRERRS